MFDADSPAWEKFVASMDANFLQLYQTLLRLDDEGRLRSYLESEIAEIEKRQLLRSEESEEKAA